MRNFCLMMICLWLAACAPGGSVTPAAQITSGAVASLPFQELRDEFAKIPGAQIAEGERLVISFPAGSLFAPGSVLPMPGGTAPLDTLINLVKQSGLNWKFKLRADTGEGRDYDSDLAAARARVLRTYFKSSGLNLRKLEIISAAESGASLELQPVL